MDINCDDVLNDIKKYPDKFFNIIYSDVPYNLSSMWKIDDKGKPYITNKNKKDFMNKWKCLDEIYLESMFNEFFRVSKFGSYLVIFNIDRQAFAYQYYAVRAGFEIQQSLYHYFTSYNIPKSSNVYNILKNKFGDIDWINKYDGYRYSISPFKQVMECILVFKKPIKNSILIDDIFEFENGNVDINPAIINIENSRVKYKSENDMIPQIRRNKRKINGGKMFNGNSMNKSSTDACIGGSVKGRYPAQLFLSKETSKIIDDQTGIKRGCHGNGNAKIGVKGKNTILRRGYANIYNDIGGMSRICNSYDIIKELEIEYMYGNFDIVKYFVKAESREKEVGLDGSNKKSKSDKYEGYSVKCKICNKYLVSGDKLCTCNENIYGSKADRAYNDEILNFHPTVKSLKLNKDISILFKLPNEIIQRVYVPFCGVFSEIIGFVKNEYKEENIYGCEIDHEYIDIGFKRLEFWRNHWFNDNDIVSESESDFINLVK